MIGLQPLRHGLGIPSGHGFSVPQTEQDQSGFSR
jgi:hypothetical protein